MSYIVGPPYDPYPNMWISYPVPIQPTPSPRTMPVNIPFSVSGFITIVTMDSDGNVTIKVDQPSPQENADG